MSISYEDWLLIEYPSQKFKKYSIVIYLEGTFHQNYKFYFAITLHYSRV